MSDVLAFFTDGHRTCNFRIKIRPNADKKLFPRAVYNGVSFYNGVSCQFNGFQIIRFEDAAFFDGQIARQPQSIQLHVGTVFHKGFG